MFLCYNLKNKYTYKKNCNYVIIAIKMSNLDNDSPIDILTKISCFYLLI